jgi:hypothetical protein
MAHATGTGSLSTPAPMARPGRGLKGLQSSRLSPGATGGGGSVGGIQKSSFYSTNNDEGGPEMVITPNSTGGSSQSTFDFGPYMARFAKTH